MTAEAPTKPGAVGWLAANRNLAGMILIVAGILLAVVPVVLIARYETNWLGTAILTALIALLWLAVGVVLRFRPVHSGSPEDEAHFLALAVGGLTGLAVAMLGLTLSFKWWDGLTNW